MSRHRYSIAPRLIVGLLLAAGLAWGLAGCATLGFGGDDVRGDDEVFRKWDDNDNDYIDPDEFSDYADWFDDYDDSDDGYLNKTEFIDGPAEDFEDVGAFGSYDTDGNGRLSEEEFNMGLFDDFDENDDGKLDQEEWASE